MFVELGRGRMGSQQLFKSGPGLEGRGSNGRRGGLGWFYRKPPNQGHLTIPWPSKKDVQGGGAKEVVRLVPGTPQKTEKEG